MASDASENESTDPGYRSRSQSRRARRKKQTNNNKRQQQPSKMPPVPEDQDTQGQESKALAKSSAQTKNQNGQTAQAESEASSDLPAQSQPGAMQPFEWIGPDSTSMDGPVTYARAMRGEIPMRPGNPEQKLKTAEKGGESDLMDQDGLKLRIELNLDIEIELKARIHGDLTLALL